MFNGKGQQWANGCLATTRHCFAASLQRSQNGGYNPSIAPWTVYMWVTVPSGPKSFSSLSWAADHSFFSFQMGKTHCLILEYTNAYTFIFSGNLRLNFSGSSFGQFYLSVLIHSPVPPLSSPVNQLPTLVKYFSEVKKGTWHDLVLESLLLPYPPLCFQKGLDCSVPSGHEKLGNSLTIGFSHN